METHCEVDNQIIQIIYSNLSEYLEKQDIFFCINNGVTKYVINIKKYNIEITHEFIDNLYRIKIKNINNNQMDKVVFLTKSKMFHNEVKEQLNKNKLSKKSFENHIYAFVLLIKKFMYVYGDLNGIEEKFIPNLKFDGIFV